MLAHQIAHAFSQDFFHLRQLLGANENHRYLTQIGLTPSVPAEGGYWGGRIHDGESGPR